MLLKCAYIQTPHKLLLYLDVKIQHEVCLVSVSTVLQLHHVCRISGTKQRLNSYLEECWSCSKLLIAFAKKFSLLRNIWMKLHFTYNRYVLKGSCMAIVAVDAVLLTGNLAPLLILSRWLIQTREKSTLTSIWKRQIYETNSAAHFLNRHYI